MECNIRRVKDTVDYLIISAFYAEELINRRKIVLPQH